MNQFGIKLRDAAPIWIVAACDDQKQMIRALQYRDLVSVKLVSGGTMAINARLIEAICGPNDPKSFDIYRK